MPTKTWVVGEEVLAADFNSYVQKQIVATFANAAARDAAIPGPTEGMMCYLNDVHQLQVRRATLWAPPPGTVVKWAVLVHVDGNFSIGALSNICDTGSILYPYPTITLASSAVHGGFGAGTCNWVSDMTAKSNGSVVSGLNPSPIQSIGGAWTSMGIQAAWTNAANIECGFVVRFNYQNGGANCHSAGQSIYQIIAQ